MLQTLPPNLMVRPNEKEEEEGGKPDPLNQLVICFSRHATTEQNALPDDFLYIAYTELMSKVCPLFI